MSTIRIPPITVGTWSFGGSEDDYWGTQNQSDTNELVREAVELNIGCFDTAEMYNSGRSETALGDILSKDGLRERSFIIGKIPPDACHPGEVEKRLNTTLQRLQSDYIDVYMVHWPFKSATCWKGDMPTAKTAFAELAKLQKSGKIKHIAVSNFGPKQMTEALGCGVQISFAELPYATFMRAIEFEVIDICKKHEIKILAYSPLMQGLLTGKYDSADEMPFLRTRTRHFNGSRQSSRHNTAGCEDQLFRGIQQLKMISERENLSLSTLCLRWVLSKPQVISVVTGCRNIQQLQENYSSCSEKLSDSLVMEIDSITEEVKTLMGPFTDYYSADNDQRCE